MNCYTVVFMNYIIHRFKNSSIAVRVNTSPRYLYMSHVLFVGQFRFCCNRYNLVHAPGVFLNIFNSLFHPVGSIFVPNCRLLLALFNF